jgi:hypothetical protein
MRVWSCPFLVLSVAVAYSAGLYPHSRAAVKAQGIDPVSFLVHIWTIETVSFRLCRHSRRRAIVGIVSARFAAKDRALGDHRLSAKRAAGGARLGAVSVGFAADGDCVIIITARPAFLVPTYLHGASRYSLRDPNRNRAGAMVRSDLPSRRSLAEREDSYRNARGRRDDGSLDD